jgi:hypothetical protein
MSKNSYSPTRRDVLASTAAASAAGVLPATLQAGDLHMANKDEIRPSHINAPETQTTNLLLLEDLEDAGKTRGLAESDLNALRAVADWTKSFVARPHRDLGRAGPVCPFVPAAFDHKTLWLAPERSAGRSAPDVIQLIELYKRLLLAAQPVDGDDANFKSIVVVFADLPAAQAKDFFSDALQQIGIPSYVDDGLVMGPFYEGNDGTALYNPNFRPFTSPVPFFLIRRAVVSDWKFFLNDEDWLGRWARRYGESAVKALAHELRRLPWRAGL